MIEDILNTIEKYKRGNLTDEEYKRHQEVMYMRRIIGREVFEKTKRVYEGILETIKFSYDGPCYIEIKRAEDESIILCLYKSFMYGEAPSYEGYDRVVKLDITSELFKSILACLSEDYSINNKITMLTFDIITKMLNDKEWYLYAWSIPLKF